MSENVCVCCMYVCQDVCCVFTCVSVGGGMYLHIYVWGCVWVIICACLCCVHTCAYLFYCAYVYVCIYVYMYVSMCVCERVSMCMYVCMCVCVCTCVCVSVLVCVDSSKGRQMDIFMEKRMGRRKNRKEDGVWREQIHHDGKSPKMG